MEDWWADLNQNIPGLAGKQVTVTGYSLGGHLATAFAQRRAEAGELSRIKHIYTFNGVGVGEFFITSAAVRSETFENVRDNPLHAGMCV